ncbi:polysaccharide biosynthesis/export family protein [Kangiella sediminilitoris]|uniref:Sugar transporter n=1 Tax=Kangiella sediminilitoris TaxID=1144748 RepID=A0A1B3BBM6_9GAMM|nr:polysaccharide biosynthesis/export family protein [Kangiella sediminilitoris]AOE50177.1 sugar transporter [Kangiella sediminilitoris]
MKLYICLAVVFVKGCVLAPGISIDKDVTSNEVSASEQVVNYDVVSITLEPFNSEKDLGTYLEQYSALISEELYQYKVQPGDVLLVTVFEHPELTMPGGPNTHPATSGTLVKADGTIYFPYIGKVAAAERTTAGIREEITSRLTKYLNNPQLDVRVVDYRSQKVSITGSVNNPKVLPITTSPLTILEAIQLAGGVSLDGDETQVRLIRGKDSYSLNLYEMQKAGFPFETLVLKDGDTVYVNSNIQKKVYVMGEVMKPQPVIISKYGLSLTQALGEVGGVDNLTADDEGIYVIRTHPETEGKFTIYHLDGSQKFAFIAGDNFMLKPRDVVYVSPSGITRWNRVLSQLLPTSVFLRNASDTGS